MKGFLKKYLFITVFALVLSITISSNADNVTNNVTNSTTTNNTTSNTASTTNNTTNSTTNSTANSTTNETKTAKTKSSNANLSTLGVTPKEYDFTGFKQNTTSYSITVPNDVNSLKVAYKTADKNAKVKITGNTGLEVGTNNIKVVVTAEDGKTNKTYTIKVTKLATEDSKPGNLIDEDESTDLYLKSLSIENLKITPEFSKDVYSYEATIDMDEKDLSKVTVKAEANNKKSEIEITGNTDLKEGENVINVIVKSSDSSEQKVYQITVNKISKASEVVSSGFHINKEHIIIGSFIAIVLIIFAVLIINHKRNKEYYEEEKEDFKDEYNFKDDDSNQNFIEDLYKRRNSGEMLNSEEEETIEDIEKENDRIFNKTKNIENFEYKEKDDYNKIIKEDSNTKRRGKHF